VVGGVLGLADFRAALDVRLVGAFFAAVAGFLAAVAGLAVAAVAGLAGVEDAGVVSCFTCFESLDTFLESLPSFLVDFFLAIAQRL
jgi:hypothetical protein